MEAYFCLESHELISQNKESRFQKYWNGVKNELLHIPKICATKRKEDNLKSVLCNQIECFESCAFKYVYDLQAAHDWPRDIINYEITEKVIYS